LQTFNFYLVRHRDSLSLIDAGVPTEACWEALMRALEQAGFSLGDVTEIMLTHHHYDHVGLVNRIVGERDIPVYASRHAIPWLWREEGFMQKRLSFLENMYREMGCGPETERQMGKIGQMEAEFRELAIRCELSFVQEGDDWFGFRVMEVPGHAPDHIALYDSQRKLLFAGDHIIRHMNANAIVEPDLRGNRRRTLIEYEQSLRRCLDIEIDRAYPGHGEEIVQPRELILERLAGIESKSQKLLERLRERACTAAELAQAYYETKYDDAFFLVMSEIIGHLDRLEAAGAIRAVRKRGIIHYEAKGE